MRGVAEERNALWTLGLETHGMNLGQIYFGQTVFPIFADLAHAPESGRGLSVFLARYH